MTVLGLVLRKLGMALVPRRMFAFRVPYEANVIEFLDVILGQLALLVRCTLTVHPFNKLLILWYAQVVKFGVVLRQSGMPLIPG